MSNSFGKHVSERQKVRTAIDRINDLEKSIAGLTSIIDREIGAAANQLSTLNDVVNALTDVVGIDAVQGVLNDKAQANLSANQAQVDMALAEGKLVKAEKVSTMSIIAYEEKDPAGNVRIPGKFFKNVTTMAQEAKNIVVGQAVGFTAAVGNGNTMTILEVYDIVPPSSVVAAPPTPAPEAAPVVDTAPVAATPVTEVNG